MPKQNSHGKVIFFCEIDARKNKTTNPLVYFINSIFANMRPLTEEETKIFFEKLSKYIGENVKHLIDRSDGTYCFRLHRERVYYVSEKIMKQVRHTLNYTIIMQFKMIRNLTPKLGNFINARTRLLCEITRLFLIKTWRFHIKNWLLVIKTLLLHIWTWLLSSSKYCYFT